MLPKQAIPQSFDELQAAIAEVCANRPVAKVEAFGSGSGGEAPTTNDVNLMVEFLPGAGTGLLEMGALKEDLEEKIGCRVNVVTRRAVEISRNQYRRHAILANPVILYSR